MIWATDRVGMAILLDPSLAKAVPDDNWATEENPVGLSPCYANRDQAVHAEVGSTSLIRSQGYEIDVMMTSYHANKDPDRYCQSSQWFE